MTDCVRFRKIHHIRVTEKTTVKGYSSTVVFYMYIVYCLNVFHEAVNAVNGITIGTIHMILARNDSFRFYTRCFLGLQAERSVCIELKHNKTDKKR